MGYANKVILLIINKSIYIILNLIIFIEEKVLNIMKIIEKETKFYDNYKLPYKMWNINNFNWNKYWIL